MRRKDSARGTVSQLAHAYDELSWRLNRNTIEDTGSSAVVYLHLTSIMGGYRQVLASRSYSCTDDAWRSRGTSIRSIA